jgi:hypothetical protein
MLQVEKIIFKMKIPCQTHFCPAMLLMLLVLSDNLKIYWPHTSNNIRGLKEF